MDLFGDAELDVADKLDAYEHKGPWTNRLILGDSLQVMNSLLEYEGMAGQVQMLYFDPPYGVKFGSNFQPFVRKRDVTHGKDDEMSREPEMVKAYRDTWELGLHSYLSYLRDRLLLARELIHESGSIFVQISDDNLHHVREAMDEVFGAENFVALIPFIKTVGKGRAFLDSVNDYLVWYSKNKNIVKYNKLYKPRSKKSLDQGYTWIEEENGNRRRLTALELRDESLIPPGRRFITAPLISQSGGVSSSFEIDFAGKKFRPSPGTFWKTNLAGIEALSKANRLIPVSSTLAYVRYEDDLSYAGTWVTP